MSAKPSSVSKSTGGQVDASRLQRNKPRLKPVFASAEKSSAVSATIDGVAVGAHIVPVATMEMVALIELVRAPENVRHVRPEEDVSALADNIAANGLLQSLIGYHAPTGSGDRMKYWVVGGGRRLAALHELLDRGALEGDYPVPVLIRPRRHAIELSLSENIEQRNMSPVDEFLAFDQLMKLGTYDETALARRFGYKVRYIRQRLRLAQAAPVVLDALADRRITLDSALAYALSQDTHLQAKVFAAQENSTWEKHAPHKVRAAYQTMQETTASSLYQFVGADAYEAAGGDYEDDLFDQAVMDGHHRKLKDGYLLIELANGLIRERAEPQESRLREQYAGYAGFTVAPDARTGGLPWTAPPAPAGFVLVQAEGGVTTETLWANAAAAEAPIKAIVGIDGAGKLAVKRDAFFVSKDFASQIRRSPRPKSIAPTPEQIERDARARAIDLRQWRLGVGTFAGTPFEGRVFWPRTSWGISAVETAPDPRLQDGQLVTAQFYVTNSEHDAMRQEAERRVDEERARAAADADATSESEQT